MMYFILFMLFIVTAYSCATNEVELQITRNYDGSADSESFKIFRGDETTGTLILSYKGLYSESYSIRKWSACTTNGEHTIVFEDTRGDGWGEAASYNNFYISINDIVIFDDTMMYKAGRLYLKDTYHFTTDLDLSLATSWSYTDIPQTLSTWKEASFDASSWNTATSSLFPSYTSITRYYRILLDPMDFSTFASFVISFRLGNGVVIYAQGQEIFRNKLSSSTITSTTVSTGTYESEPVFKKIYISKLFLSETSPICLAIEVHLPSGITSGTDLFAIYGRRFFTNSKRQYSSSLLSTIGNTIVADHESSTQTTNSKNMVDSNLNSMFTTAYSQTYVVISSSGKTFYWFNAYSIVFTFSTRYDYPTSWKVYGSNDQYNWTLLHYVNNFVRVSQSNYFPVYNVQKAYSMIKIEFLASSANAGFSLSNFNLHQNTHSPLSSTPAYDLTSFTGFSLIDNMDLMPVTGGYTSYSISPSLPSGLTMYDCGYIKGSSQLPYEGTFTITALNSNTNQNESAQLFINFVRCSSPNYAYLRFIKKSSAFAVEEVFNVAYPNGTIIITSPEYPTSSTVTTDYCIPASLVVLTINDTYGDGWYYESELSVFIKDSDESFRNILKFTYLFSLPAIYDINTHYLIDSYTSSWKFIQGQIPVNWNAILEPQGFTTLSSPAPTSTSNIWLFRHSFNIESKIKFLTCDIYVKFRAGCVIYINSIEVYRKGISTTIDNIDINTLPTLSTDVPTYTTVVSDIRPYRIGLNTIAIGIINVSGSTSSLIDFDCGLQLMYNNANNRFIDYETTSDPFSYFVDRLTDTLNGGDWDVTVPYGQSATITISYGTNRAQYINKYCFTSSSLSSDFDPSDWAVYGSNDDTQYILLGTILNAYFSAREAERCFYISNSNAAWTYYKFSLTEPAGHNQQKLEFALSEIAFFNIDFEQLDIPDLFYEQTLFMGYIGIPFPDMMPSSSYFCNFQISPSLPSPLEIDTTTGSIRGIPTTSMPMTSYTITAYSPINIAYNTVIRLMIVECVYPNVMFSIMIFGGLDSKEQGFELYDEAKTLVFSKFIFTPEQASYFPFCRPHGLYSLTLYDAASNGWGSGYYNVLLEDGTVILNGSIGQKEKSKSIPLNIGYVITPLHTNWKYYNANNIPSESWTLNSYDDSSWSVATPLSFGNTNGITQYFRYHFSLDTSKQYASIIFNIHTKSGAVAYINGKQALSFNMPEPPFVYTTYAVNQYTSVQNVGESFSLYQHPLINGDNVVAVEIHKHSSASTSPIDFDMDLQLTAKDSYRILDGTPSCANCESSSLNKLYDNYQSTIMINTKSCTNSSYTWTYKNNRKEYISAYSITTGNICNVFHPSDFILEASNDNIHWSTLDVQTSILYTSFYETRYFQFYNEKSFNMYRFTVTGCNNNHLSGESTTVTCDSRMHTLHLADLSLYATYVESSCPSENGFSGAINNAFAYKDCDDFYEGRYQAVCHNGVLGSIMNYCYLMAPYNIKYSSSILDFEQDTAVTYVATVSGIYYSCSSTSLPSGVVLDRATGDLSGTVNDAFSRMIVNVTCTNAAGAYTTSVTLNYREKAPIPVALWITFIVLIIIVIVLAGFCIKHHIKKTSKKGHIKVEKKVSALNKAQSKSHIAPVTI